MSAARPPILLASPRGFCAGVERAVEIAELALEVYGPPVYVRHEIVHNRRVVEDLRAKGAVFVEELDEIPAGDALVIYSAHGVAPAVRDAARARGLRTLDATCPLVTKVHVEALRCARDGYEILLVGHRGHVEVEGTLGHARDAMHLVESREQAEQVQVRNPERLAVLTQTTLSVDDTREILAVLARRFPALRLPKKDDICYATQNRQNAVKALAQRADRVLVVGAPSSSNSNRLVEVARACGARAELVESATDVPREWVAGARALGVTAGASTPQVVVDEVIAELVRLGAGEVEELVTELEDVHFTLPLELRDARRQVAGS